MKATDIAGYTYQAENHRPGDLIEMLIMLGVASPAARGMAVEDALDQIAAANGIDRNDERSFDSSEFPKPVFVSDLTAADHATWFAD